MQIQVSSKLADEMVVYCSRMSEGQSAFISLYVLPESSLADELLSLLTQSLHVRDAILSMVRTTQKCSKVCMQRKKQCSKINRAHGSKMLVSRAGQNFHFLHIHFTSSLSRIKNSPLYDRKVNRNRYKVPPTFNKSKRKWLAQGMCVFSEHL